MGTILQDFRYGLRMLWKSPGYTAIAIITLALGIGANTTIFSWINSTLLNPVPGLATPSEVVSLSMGKTAQNAFPFSYPDYVAMRDAQKSFQGITAFAVVPFSLTGNGKPQRV